MGLASLAFDGAWHSDVVCRVRKRQGRAIINRTCSTHWTPSTLLPHHISCLLISSGKVIKHRVIRPHAKTLLTKGTKRLTVASTQCFTPIHINEIVFIYVCRLLFKARRIHLLWNARSWRVRCLAVHEGTRPADTSGLAPVCTGDTTRKGLVNKLRKKCGI